MPVYDSVQFDPPIPLALVALRNPVTGIARSDVPMLLDSGADVTLTPREIGEPLEGAIVQDVHYELVGFDGSVSFAAVTRMELIFCHRTFRGQFLLIDQSWGVLGRNVLNAIPLLLDGPRPTWEEHRPA